MSFDFSFKRVARSSAIAPLAPTGSRRGNRSRFAGGIAFARPLIQTGVILAAAAAGCRTHLPGPSYQLVSVQRRDLLLSVTATGAIQPDTTVVIKSQATGEVLVISAGDGQLVQRDSVMAEIDQRTPRNNLLQAEAAVEVAKARLATEEETFRRGDKLFRTQSITQQEHDSLVVTVPTPVEVETGLTDLDYSEVLRGLSPGDSVLVPSPSLDEKLSQVLSRRLQRLGAAPGA